MKIKKFLAFVLVLSTLASMLVALPVQAEAEIVSPDKITAYANSATSLGNVENLKDGDHTTYWHSGYKAEGGVILDKDDPDFYLTYEFDEPTLISGFKYYPRTDDNPAGIVTIYEFYGLAEGEEEAELIMKGTMPGNGVTVTKELGYNLLVEAVVFVVKSGNSGYGTCAELEILGEEAGVVTKKLEGDEATIPVKFETTLTNKPDISFGVQNGKSGIRDFTAVASSSSYSVENMFDGDKDSYWHSYFAGNWSATTGRFDEEDNPPFRLTITFDNPTYISGINYVPRQDRATGRFLQYTVYGLDEIGGDEYILSTGTMANSPTTKYLDFMCNVKVKAIIVEATATAENYGTCAELEFHRYKDEYINAETAKEFEATYEKIKPNYVDTREFIVTDNGSWGSGFGGAAAFDGIRTSYWHSDADRPNVYPCIVYVDMSLEHELTAFHYLPRHNASHGYLLDFVVQTSLDGETYETQGSYILPSSEQDNKNERYFEFDEPVNARFVKIIVNNGVGGFASAAEFQLYETYESAKYHKKLASEKYTLQIDNNMIYASTINGDKMTRVDQAPMIEKDRTLIPLRGLLETMGASVRWNASNQTITITKGEVVIKLQNQNQLIYVTRRIMGLMKEVRYTLDVPPMIYGSRTMIPIRFIAEKLGYVVEWVPETREIIIKRG